MTNIQELTEKVKDFLETIQMTHDDRIKVNDLLSQIRLQVNLLDRNLVESHLRQNIYSEIAEKILNKIIETRYD